MHEQPIALEAFSCLADAYAARIDAKAHNAFYDRPAVLSLLPPVEGRRVSHAAARKGSTGPASKKGPKALTCRGRRRTGPRSAGPSGV